MRIACESVADNELCPLNALVSALTTGRRMTSHMDMLRRSNSSIPVPLRVRPPLSPKSRNYPLWKCPACSLFTCIFKLEDHQMIFQFKNSMVLRLASLVVESGIFKKVNFLFLVRGCAKNPCDRMFNVLKLRFRKQNVCTMEHLLKVLNEQDQVNALRVLPLDFYRIDAFLDKFYR
jgi:hypothetical protein